MSTTTPPILDGSGTIAKIYTFTADETKELKVDLGALSTTVTSLDVQIRNLTQDTLIETISFTGLSGTEKLEEKTVTVTGLTGDEIGLVATQTPSNNWVSVTRPTEVDALGDPYAPNSNAGWLFYHLNNSQMWVRRPDGTFQDEGDGNQPNNFYGMYDASSNQIVILCRSGLDKFIAVKDMAAGTWENWPVASEWARREANQFFVEGNNGWISTDYGEIWQGFKGSAWTKIGNFIARKIFKYNGDLYAIDNSFNVLKYDGSGTSWTDQGWNLGTAGAGGISVVFFNTDQSKALAYSADSNLSIADLDTQTNTTIATSVSGSTMFYMDDAPHLVDSSNNWTKLETSYPVEFSSLSVTEIIPSNGPHVYNAIRETILRPDSGPHIYNVIRETIFGEIKAPEGAYVKSQYMDVVLTPQPGPNLKSQYQDIVLRPELGPFIKSMYQDIVITPQPGPNIKSQYIDVVMFAAPSGGLLKQTASVVIQSSHKGKLHKQTMSVVIAPPPPETRLLKQTISTVIAPDKWHGKLLKQTVSVVVMPAQEKRRRFVNSYITDLE